MGAFAPSGVPYRLPPGRADKSSSGFLFLKRTPEKPPWPILAGWWLAYVPWTI